MWEYCNSIFFSFFKSNARKRKQTLFELFSLYLLLRPPQVLHPLICTWCSLKKHTQPSQSCAQMFKNDDYNEQNKVNHNITMLCQQLSIIWNRAKTEIYCSFNIQSSCAELVQQKWLGCDSMVSQGPRRHPEATRPYPHIAVWLWELCSDDQLTKRQHTCQNFIKKPLHPCAHLQIQPR